jgi:gliding motility-associated-like protein
MYRNYATTLFTHIILFMLAGGPLLPVCAQQMQVKKNNYESFQQPLYYPTPPGQQAFANHPEMGVIPWNAPCNDCYEVLAERTLSTRKFIRPDGTFIQERSYGRLHYLDAQGWLRTINHQLRPIGESGHYEASSQDITTELDIQEGYAALQLKNGWIWKHNAALRFNGKQISYHAPSVGDDGAWLKDAWPGTDAEMVFGRGSIKTNYVLKDMSAVDAALPWQEFSEHFILPEGMQVVVDPLSGYTTPDGWWKGSLLIMDHGVRLGSIGVPWVIDQTRTKQHGLEQVNASGYIVEQHGRELTIRLLVKTDWLLSAERQYPVIVDPLLTGEGTYTASDIGFEFNTVCWDDADYCGYSMDVTVPGTTTLTAAYFDGTYYSQNFGCFFTTDCLMAEAAFRILGPCDDSPSPDSYWTCVPPIGDSSGTCYGVDLDMFNTISCIPPQCADYVFNFEMRTFHCSCTKPPCDITCHYMPIDSWVVTIEGLTVEENPIQSDTYPDFIICEGDSIDLFATGNWGVPPYEYEWLPGGTFADTIWVAPLVDTWYTAIIHDVCDVQDTVQQLVTVNPAPVLAPGPFEDCFEVTADAGSGYASYVWSDGQTGQFATFDSSGTYTVTVVDGNGCSGVSDPIEVIVHTYPEIDAQPDTVYVSDGELAEMLVTTSSTGSVDFSWTPAENVTCTDCAETNGIVYEALAYFYVTGTEFGCESPPDTIVVINEQTDLIVPNAFTPNDDGLNDVFKPYSELIYPVYTLNIYNRWGEPVFFSDDMLKGWDGTLETIEQEVGTYIWVIEYERFNDQGKLYTRRGTVTLLR